MVEMIKYDVRVLSDGMHGIVYWCEYDIIWLCERPWGGLRSRFYSFGMFGLLSGCSSYLN